jgi:hypothetical protein
MSCFTNPKKRLELGIEEDEVGGIEEAAFDIIRLRTIPDMPKVHAIMRDLPKYCRTPEGKSAILKIADKVEPVLPNDECVDKDGKQLAVAEIEAKWAIKFREPIIYNLKKAATRHESQKERDTPLELLDAAYKKLTHPNMDLGSTGISDLHKARELTTAIYDRAHELEGQIYKYEKDLKKLLGRKHD